MKKNILFSSLVLLVNSFLFAQHDGNMPPDSVPRCQAYFQYYLNDSIKTFAEAYPYQFIDYSKGNASKWEWDFGDGNTSAEANPMHFYQHAWDTVNVCLTITTMDNCKSTYCETIIVGSYWNPPVCNISFLAQRDPAANCLCYRFQGISDEPYSAWQWEFGDGTVSSEESPLHSFPGEGIYNVCLSAAKSDGQVCTYCQQVYSGWDSLPNPCRINFDIQTLESYPLQYRFVPSSEDAGDYCYWDFGDGQSSYETNPVHLYDYSGFYTVCLSTKTSDGCFSYECLTQYFEGRSEDCQAYWQGYPADYVIMSSIWPPDSAPYFPSNTYFFNDYSKGRPVSWHWNFNDGTESYEQNPFHTFPGPGIYNVCLQTMTADSCKSQYCDSIWIGIQKPCGLTGTVVDYSGLDGCGLLIQLDNGLVLEPAQIVPPFKLQDGQRIRLSYTELNDMASICMAGTIVRIDCIEEIAACKASFTHYALEWVSSLPPLYQFDDLSAADVTSWQWDFGDGTVVFERSPMHRYELSGYYTVCLTIYTAEGCSDTYCETSYYEGRLPQPELCNYNLTLKTEMVLGPVYSCDGWASAGLIDANGNAAEAQSYWWSTGSNENYVEGLCSNTEYVVTAIDPDGCLITGSFITYGTILPVDPYFGNWNYEKDGMDFIFNLPVYEEGYQCVWEFGDGRTSEGNNVSHTYDSTGEYTVVLKLYDDKGNITYTRNINVNAGSPVAIPEHSGVEMVSVYPVPARDYLTIQLVSGDAQNMIVEIYSSTGQQVLSQEINALEGQQTYTLDVSDLPAGVFYGILKQENRNTTAFKFVK